MVICKYCGTELHESYGPQQNAGSGDGKHFSNECRDILVKEVARLKAIITVIEKCYMEV